MPINNKFDKCCGCLACMNACPKDAIEISKDENGFIYPFVNTDKCINCGICEKVCAFNRKKGINNRTIKTLSLVINDKKELYESTSGGAFTALTDYILNNDGVVYGTILDDNFDVYFIRADSKTKRDKMRGSKYVQSNTNLIYRKVKKDLESGLFVAFIGTPCQIDGLNAFLCKKYSNLLTIDFLCHGVPNNDFFKAHINYLEKKYKCKAKTYSFRDKKFSWNPSGIEEISFCNNIKKSSFDVQAYNYFFHCNVSLRPSCLKCPYRNTKRCSDFTIADFWGYNKLYNKNNSTGVSLLLINTIDGIKAFNNLDKSKITTEDIPYKNIQYRISPKHVVSKYDVKEFWDYYDCYNYEGIVKKYINKSFVLLFKYYIKKTNRFILSKINMIKK